MKNKKIAHIITFFAKILFRHRWEDVFLYQSRLIHRFIKKNIRTEFGQKYSFDTIQSIDDFRARVPLHSYDDLQGYIERMMAGETNVLRKGEADFFAKSSGTTAVSKYIPITHTALRKNHFAVPQMGMGMYLSEYGDANIFGGQGIILGGRMIQNPYNPSKNNVGDVSAILQTTAPRFTKFFRKPSPSISFLADFDQKLDGIIDETVGLPITYVAGVPSRISLLFQRVAQRFPYKSISEIWPSLELFLWGGISIAPYKKQLENLLQGTKIRLRYRQTYNASEGFFAIQDKANRQDMILAVNHHIFFEFISFEDIENKNPHTLLAHELSVGQKYELVITTDGGLWRYRIGDVIKVTYNQPLRIEVTGRTKSFLNVFGEELMIHTTDGAIQYICEIYNLPRIEYVATTVVQNDGGYHQRYIDFGYDVLIDHSTFTKTLEGYIQDHNSDYSAKRAGDILMKHLQVVFLPPGTFHRYLESKGKLGGQHKIKRLRNDKEELMKEMGEYITCL